VEKETAEGRFRADLLARLGHTLVIPPLRERPEDVPLLAEHFLQKHTRGGRGKTFAPETLALLQRYRWEFNVRQLQQVVEHAFCLGEGDVVTPEDLPAFLRDAASPRGGAAAAADGPPGPLRDVVQEAEKAHILRALEHTKGNRRQAIELLQVSPETFYKRLEEFGLKKTDK
jgi:DNA-binding NtrC family response regulator